MHDLFDPTDRRSILDRIDGLNPQSQRQWGKMEIAQMMAHCAVPLEQAASGRQVRQRLIGKLLAPFVRGSILGEKPFGRNAPTDPDFKVADPRDFAQEKTRLLAAIDAFVRRGPDAMGNQTHPFFGRMRGQQWGWLMYKHLDHHLRQFGA